MDTIGKTWRQTSDLWASLAPSQRLSLLVVPLLLFGGFAYLLWGGASRASMTPLAFGKVMTDSELDEAESVLVAKGLKEFERSGNQLLVPSAQVEEYHGALLAGGGLPSGWAEEFEKKFDQSSVFTSGDQRRTMREIALAKEMRRWLRAIPEVVDGNVVWARSQRRIGFSGSGSLTRDAPGRGVTATVTLKPKPGREISADLAESVRRMIANAVPDLTPDQIVVFSTTGRAFTPEDENDPFNGKLLRRIRDFTDMYRRRVEAALEYIPGVLVTVHVDVDNVHSDHTRKFTVDPKGGADTVIDEEVRNRTTASKRPRAEPGAVSNTPQSLNLNDGPAESTSDNTTNSRTIRTNSHEIRDTKFVAGMPTGVQVSVGIPEDYYENAVANTGVERGTDEAGEAAFTAAVAEFRATVQKDVAATVSRAIGATDEKVSVTSYVRVTTEPPTLAIPMSQQVNDWLRIWGSTLGLALFAAAALWMVVRSGPKGSEESDEDLSVSPFAAPPAPEDDEVVEPLINARDELQSTVRDNPEIAAAVIGKWIRAVQ